MTFDDFFVLKVLRALFYHAYFYEKVYSSCYAIVFLYINEKV